MKVSSKFKVIGIIVLITGIVLTILSFTAFKTCVNCKPGWEGHRDAFGERYTPNMFLIFFGSTSIMIGISLLFMGLRPQMMKTAAKLNNETLDYAGKEVSETLEKTVDVAAPAIEKTADVVGPAIGKVVSNVKGKSGKKSQLDEAKALYENGDISEEEYEAMRKNILDIEK